MLVSIEYVIDQGVSICIFNIISHTIPVYTLIVKPVALSLPSSKAYLHPITTALDKSLRTLRYPRLDIVTQQVCLRNLSYVL